MRIEIPAEHKLVFRLLWVPFGTIAFFVLLDDTGRSVNNLVYHLTEDSFGLYLNLTTREFFVIALSAIVAIAHATLEIAAYFNDTIARSRTIKHLRYAPVAVMVLSLLSIAAFDIAMIELSKRQIRNYVYNGSSAVETPDFDRLHSNYRGWCGNGASAAYEYQYYPTASAGLRDSDPAVRARSFQASSKVRDFFNGSPRFRSDTIAACGDDSWIVREAVEQHLAKSETSCSAILSSSKKAWFH